MGFIFELRMKKGWNQQVSKSNKENLCEWVKIIT